MKLVHRGGQVRTGILPRFVPAHPQLSRHKNQECSGAAVLRLDTELNADLARPLQFFGDSGIAAVGPWGPDVTPNPVMGKFLNPSVSAGEPSFTV